LGRALSNYCNFRLLAYCAPTETSQPGGNMDKSQASTNPNCNVFGPQTRPASLIGHPKLWRFSLPTLARDILYVFQTPPNFYLTTNETMKPVTEYLIVISAEPAIVWQLVSLG